MDFELQEGGKAANPQELTQVSDWGELTQPTHLQLERRRVYCSVRFCENEPTLQQEIYCGN
ncbi:hypothetical protein DSN25_15385 [Salmonella enterica subsp. salamae]|nr:hypothetical protein [Salmonella enterica subsp. salamae]ECJ4595981.1 hypothetical protein [Salmonella enterica subsp. salamae]